MLVFILKWNENNNNNNISIKCLSKQAYLIASSQAYYNIEKVDKKIGISPVRLFFFRCFLASGGVHAKWNTLVWQTHKPKSTKLS